MIFNRSRLVGFGRDRPSYDTTYPIGVVTRCACHKKSVRIQRNETELSRDENLFTAKFRLYPILIDSVRHKIQTWSQASSWMGGSIL